MPKTQGVIVYKIERDGCLNGFYTTSDNGKSHELYNEIARKIDPSENMAEDAIAGKYVCSWININNEVMVATLTIHNCEKSYELTWNVAGNDRYKGTGYITGAHQLTVSYTSID